MKTTAPFSDELLCIFAQPLRGIVGLVDDLLTACRGRDLRIVWQSGRCQVHSPGGNGDIFLDLPVRKSIFRAILARVAVLCNERQPNSVSPYGGRGEIAVGTVAPVVFRVHFVNTPGEQLLDLNPETGVENTQRR